MSNIQKARAELIELKNIHTEVNRLKQTLKQLITRSKVLTENIHKYLKDTNQQSITYDGFKIEAVNKQRRQRKKQAEKEKDAVQVLQNAGIRDPKRLYNEILNSMKGEVASESSVKIDTTKK